MPASVAAGAAPVDVEAAAGLVPDGSASEDEADVRAEPFGTLVASETSCRDEVMAPSGASTVVGSDEVGLSAAPAGERSEDPARSDGVAPAIVEAVPATTSGAEEEPGPGTADPAEPGLGAATISGEAVEAGKPEPCLGPDAWEVEPELAVAVASGAVGLERGVTRTRAGVPM